MCFTALVLATFILAGCSTGSVVTSPGAAPPLVENNRISEHKDPGHFLWLYNNIYISEDRTEWEIVPMRIVESHWNVLKWLEQGPCTDCFKLVAVNPTGAGTLNVDVEISHPFSLSNLTGFDVRGIAIFEGSHTFPESGLVMSDRTQGNGQLINPDGYTSLYNPSTAGSGPAGMQGYISGRFEGQFPDATLNGYMRHISPGSANTRNALYAGTAMIVTYEVDMPDGGFVFGYAVDASWAPPDIKPVTDPMTDFPPEANCPEPWKIEITETPIWNGITSGGGQATLTIDVYDWSGKDSHAWPVIECTELFDGELTAQWVSDGSGFSTYEINIENVKLAEIGAYPLLVSVEDDLNTGAPEWLDLTAYQVHYVEVVEFTPEDPVIVLEMDDPPYTVCEEINFDASGSYDPDGGAIATFEWDWENDGTWDDTGVVVTHSYDDITAGTGDSFEVNLRITDDEGASIELDPLVEIDIINNLPTPILDASSWSPYLTETLTFDGSNSLDNDCDNQSITDYQIDFEDDGNWDEINDTGIFTHSYDPTGQYSVDFRVKDDEGVWVELETPEILYSVEGWADTWGNPDGNVHPMDVDAFGLDLSVVGFFSGTVDFDPGPGEDLHTSNGGDDAFLVSFNYYGEFKWAVTWGGPENDRAYGLVSWFENDAVVGYFNGTVDFDPGDGVTERTSNGGSDAFAVLFYEEDDQPVLHYPLAWGGIGEDCATSIDTDNPDTQDMIITGYFEDTVDFDPDSTGTYLIPSHGGRDAFLLRMDFNLFWFVIAAGWGGPDDDMGHSVYIDSNSVYYIAGEFAGTADLNPQGGTDWHIASGTEVDAFVMQFDATNVWQWATSWGGTGIDIAYDVYADTAVYVAGTFQGNVNWNKEGSPVNETSVGGHDCYIRTCTTSETFGRAITWGGVGDDFCYAISSDKDVTAVIASGSIEGDVLIELEGGGIFDYSSAGMSDAFIVAVDKMAEEPDWIIAFGGERDDSGTGTLYRYSYQGSSFYACGMYTGTVDFNMGPGEDIHTAQGLADGWLVRYPESGVW